MSFPSFASGEVLTAADMNAVGLWLVKTQTIGTGVTSVTVSGAFSATYNNYKILIDGGSASTNANLILTLGSKTSNYRSNLIYSSWTTNIQAIGSTTATGMIYAGNISPSGQFLNVELISPFLSTNTFSTGHWSSSNDTGVSQMQTNDTTSYTAFTLTCGAGNMTGGTIRVYGYRN